MQCSAVVTSFFLCLLDHLFYCGMRDWWTFTSVTYIVIITSIIVSHSVTHTTQSPLILMRSSLHIIQSVVISLSLPQDIFIIIHYNPSLIPHIHLRHLIFPRSYSDSARDCTHPSGLTSLTFPFAYPLSFLSLPFPSHRLFFPSSLLLLSTLLAFPNRSRFILRNVVAKKIEEESGATDEQCIEGLG